MTEISNIPSLASIALEYGTIQQEQYRQITALYTLRQKQKPLPDYADLLLGQGFATQYQIELLQLIQEYHIIKHLGEKFGKIAVAKGFATHEDVRKAMEHQKSEFRRAKVKILIGDILEAAGVITPEQKQQILKEQTFLEHQSNQIYSSAHHKTSGQDQKNKTLPLLSEYEQQFLQIKALDREFAAAVIEKKLATQLDVAIAGKAQEEAFEAGHSLKHLGDIMVDMGMLTQAEKQMVLLEQNRLQHNDRESFSSHIQVQISQDKTEASVIIAKEDMAATSLEALKQALASSGITHGIYPDPLLQTHLAIQDLQFIAAKTDFSTDLLQHTQAKCFLETELTDSGEKRKGQVLMTQTSGPDTYLKTDVFGKKSHQNRGTDFTFHCGGNTRPARDGLGVVAAKTGVPGLSVERKLFVHPKISVLEDADLRYGPLEPYADLSISGILYGAYPVTAGHITAREIRDAEIDAVKDITVAVGITDTIIRTQGDIYARYLHNCRIETFGNIYIKNEIIDSVIHCSGKVDAGQCRVVSSDIYATKGVVLRGVGSQRTRSCIIASGAEHHIVMLGRAIQQKILRINEKLDDLKTQHQEQDHMMKKTFQKMVEMKLFHDRAKYKKRILEKEKDKIDTKAANEKNISTLAKNFEKRMENAIIELKELNRKKKDHNTKKDALENEIASLAPVIEKQILSLVQSRCAVYEWARSRKNICTITVSGKAFQGTEFRGIFCAKVLASDMEKFSVVEQQQQHGHKITLKPLQGNRM